MASKTMYFSRSSSGYNAENGDYIDYTPDASISFGSQYKCTHFYFSIDGGLTSASSSGRHHGANLQVKSNGTWYKIWSDGELWLPKKGTTGYSFEFNGAIPSNVQVTLATYGITDLRLQQEENIDGYNYALRGTTGSGTLQVEYEINASLGKAGTPSITQNTNAATYTISWAAASGSGGTILYNPYDISSGYVSSWTSSTSRTINIPDYDVSHTWEIDAKIEGTDLFTTSSRASKTFYKPSITAPSGLKVASATAQTCALSWTAAKLNYTNGTITYSIRRNGTEIATTTSTSYTVAETTTKGWGTSASTMTVVAKGTSLGNTASGTTLTSSATSGVSYTYRAAVTTHPSGLKINKATSYTGATAPLTWSAAAFSGGQTPTYSIRVDGTQIATTTNTSYTIPESTTKSYTSAVTITVVATGGGATSNATNGVTYTYQPTITAPSGLKINSGTSYTGRTAPLTWTAGSLSNGGTVTYSIRKGGVEFATTTSTSYTVAESVTKNWGTSAITITVVATGAGLTSGASNGVTYTYQPAFTANPTNLKINGGTSYTGQTAPLTWTAATISNGVTITYTIYNGTTAVTTTTNTSYTIPESTTKNWTSAVILTIKASASGITSDATSEVTYTYRPVITAPSNLKIDGGTSYTGQTAPLSWTAGSLSNGAAITYYLRKDGVQFATTTSTSYTAAESIVKNWGTSTVKITVVATGSGLTSEASNEVTFTYKPPFKTVKYHTGSNFVECIGYYHNGTRWVKCDIYYHDGTGWKLSDH